MHRYCKLMIISVVLLAACSDQSGEPGQIVECEGSLAPCTFQEIIPAILRRHPVTPLETPPFTIDLIKERYGVEEIDCSHPIISDNSKFIRIAGLTPDPDTKIWFSHEELEEYEDIEIAWECNNGESFTEYVKGSPRSTSEFHVIDQTTRYVIVEGTVTDPEVLKQLEALWENCKVGTEPPNFTGVFTSGTGFLPPENQSFCVTLDILPGAKQCFAKTTPPEFIEYSMHTDNENDPIEQTVSENDYCYPEENPGSQAGRIKIF